MADNAEIQQFFNPILQAIQSYANDYDSLMALREVSEESLGENWRSVIADYLRAYGRDIQVSAGEKLSAALQYDGSVSAWEEASALLADPDVSAEHIYERFHDLSIWLEYFGDGGTELIEALRERIAPMLQGGKAPAPAAVTPEPAAPVKEPVPQPAQEETSATGQEELRDLWEGDISPAEKPQQAQPSQASPAAQASPEKQAKQRQTDYDELHPLPGKCPPYQKISQAEADEFRITPPVLWNLNAFLILNDYYDRSLCRIAARCIRMGGISLNEYPCYPYVLDLLDEMVNLTKDILKAKELAPLIERYCDGGLEGFKRLAASYEKEYEENMTPEMVKEDDTELSRLIAGTKFVSDEEIEYGNFTSASDGFIPQEEEALPDAPPPPPVRSLRDMDAVEGLKKK